VVAIAGVSIWGVLLVALAMGLGGAAMLTIGGGAYGAYPHVMLRTALWTSLVVAAAITALDRMAASGCHRPREPSVSSPAWRSG
jgi:hypothetical protein